MNHGCLCSPLVKADCSYGCSWLPLVAHGRHWLSTAALVASGCSRLSLLVACGSENCFGLGMVVLGCRWLPPVVAGGTCVSLVVAGCRWLLLAILPLLLVTGCFLLFLVVAGCCWMFMVVPGSVWLFLVVSGSSNTSLKFPACLRLFRVVFLFSDGPKVLSGCSLLLAVAGCCWSLLVVPGCS